MRHWLTILGLACASVAVLVTTFSPLDAAEPSPDESITTELHPGWNMVGWLGPEAPVSELFEAVPALQRIYAWNSEAQRYQSALPARTPQHGLRQLIPGMGLWLFIEGDRPVAWTRPVAAEGRVLPLHAGWNLVAWSGDAWSGDAGFVGGTLTRYGDSLVKAFRWDAAVQQYDRHRPWADAATTLRGLNRGDALWLELTADGHWWVPGTAQPTFLFGDHLSAEEREFTRRVVAHARAVFAEHFGIHTADFTVSVPQELPITLCVAGPRHIVAPPADPCTPHEYFHVLQFALADGLIGGPHGRAPNWLIEGPASYAGWGALGATINQGVASHRPASIAAVARVPSLQNPQGADQSAVDYHLGFLATEWLVDYAGAEALVDYYRRLPSSNGWESAFAEAFGLSVEDFYTAFAAYRAVVAPPLPHLADDAVRPVVVFLGDVPMDVRTAVQTEMDRVHTFFGESFGVNDVEYSLFLGADWDAIKETVYRLSPYSHGAEEKRICGINRTEWTVSKLGCGGSYLHAMIRMSLDSLLPWRDLATAFDIQTEGWSPDRLSPRLPLRVENQPLPWFPWGLNNYVHTSYQAAQGTSVSRLFHRYTVVLQRFAIPLRELETREGLSGVGAAKSIPIATMAVDWLAKRAGEPALLEYYRLLPRGSPGYPNYDPRAGSQQAAFQQAFGLTVDEFYEAFETYRATLTLP